MKTKFLNVKDTYKTVNSNPNTNLIFTTHYTGPSTMDRQVEYITVKKELFEKWILINFKEYPDVYGFLDWVTWIKGWVE